MRHKSSSDLILNWLLLSINWFFSQPSILMLRMWDFILLLWMTNHILLLCCVGSSGRPLKVKFPMVSSYTLLGDLSSQASVSHTATTRWISFFCNKRRRKEAPFSLHFPATGKSPIFPAPFRRNLDGISIFYTFLTDLLLIQLQFTKIR